MKSDKDTQAVRSKYPMYMLILKDNWKNGETLVDHDKVISPQYMLVCGEF